MTTKFVSALALATLVFSSAAAVWTYDPDARTLSGNGWTLIGVTANADKELTIPAQSQSLVDDDGTGVLDFSDGVADGYSIVEFGNQAFCRNGNVTAFIAPSSLRVLNRHVFGYCSHLTKLHLDCPALETADYCAFYDCGAVTELRLSIPNLKIVGGWAFNPMPLAGGSEVCLNLEKIERIDESAFANNKAIVDVRLVSDGLVSIGANAFLDCGNITNLLLRAPNLRSIGFKAFSKLPFVADAGEWRLDSLETIGNQTFDVCPGLSGVLRLPCATNLGAWLFWQTTSLEGIRLESPDTVTIQSGAFCDGIPSLREIVIGTKNDLVLAGDNSVEFFGYAKDITFWGPAQSEEVLNRILKKSTDYKTRLIVSKKQEGWLDLVTPLTEADLAHADYPSDLVAQGMKVLGTTAGKLNKTVWVVHSPSPYDPQGGMLIIVR